MEPYYCAPNIWGFTTLLVRWIGDVVKFLDFWILSSSCLQFHKEEGLFRVSNLWIRLIFLVSGWSVHISLPIEFCSEAKVPSVRRISVSSAKHADPHVIVFFSSGRNIVSRSFSFNVEWWWRRSRPVYSLHVGPGWRGPPFGVWFVVNTWILSLSWWILPSWHPTICECK